MPKRNNHAQFSIECGATTDSFDNLKNNVRLKPKNFYQPLTFPPKNSYCYFLDRRFSRVDRSRQIL